MDLTREVIYRGFTLNPDTADISLTSGGGIGSGIDGCMLDSVDYSDVDIVQFTEKRSQQDGMDAGDVFKGMRRIRMSGTLYGLTRATLYDNLFTMRAALDPVLAQRESPLDRGYQPLYFSVPTNRIDDYPTGAIELRILAMPRAQQAIFDRERMGGDDSDSLAIPWQCTFICKDPSVQAASPQDYDLSAGGTVTGNTVNRGTYIAPLNAVIEVGSAAGSIAVTVGDSVFTVTVPSSTGNRIIRIKGDPEKILTFEEGGVETTRMDLITFSGLTTWPLIDTGTAVFSWHFISVSPVAGSHFFFYERYA